MNRGKRFDNAITQELPAFCPEFLVHDAAYYEPPKLDVNDEAITYRELPAFCAEVA